MKQEKQISSKLKIPNRVSHSSIKDYSACPLLFLYRKILYLELPYESVHLHFGKSLHRALELYSNGEKDYNGVFLNTFTPEKLEHKDLAKYYEFRETGLKMLEQYVQQNKSFDWKVTKTEEKATFSNVEDPTTGTKLLFNEITGVIDFETNTGCLGDYKTSGHKYKQEEADSSLQPTLYYLLYWLKHKTLPKKFIYVVFLKKRKKDMIQILETKRTFKDITNLINTINKIYEKVEKEQFQRGHDSSTFCDCYKYEELLRPRKYDRSRTMVFDF